MLADGFHGVPAGKLAMVVTYLEMRAPTDMRPATLPNDTTFTPIAPTLSRYRDIFNRVGSQNWLWYGRLKMADTELGAIVNDPDVQIYTLQKEGRDEALLELDFRQSGECELAYFGLTPALIGTGAGRFLMNEAIARAWARGISRFHVHTCTLDSPQALAFYIRSGFTPYKRAIEVDDDPRVTGLLSADAAENIPVI